MNPLEEVRLRARTDHGFRRRLLADPVSALVPYPLTGAELLQLADDLDDDSAIVEAVQRLLDGRVDRRT